MTARIQNKIKALSGKPLTRGELDIAARHFMDAVDCLVKMKTELSLEGCYINKSINKGARGRTQFARPKYAPVRIC
ncbi:MAG: hypothetical protein J6M62_10200 [Selenomonadaceae bacterium]|nr:hypothetical protein [Selenomonadaceae bacterium]